MAKVSPGSIKYMIHASFKAEGPVEKPDVIGAIFGQTEGLLGDELEMRELQKEGKIGRIEVELQIVDGKSVGSIQVPSALDKSETTLIAAALETIERIGPTEGKITIDKIEDVRGSKRDYILERAKKLMEVIGGNSTNFDELSKEVTEGSRVAKIQEYGEEKLPAGDLSGVEIIVVEGRADVVNLLKNRVNNVIGMNGTKLPAEIAKLGEEKEITLFIDGDRGGKLIAHNVINNAKIAYVAIAPDGKEVEELVGKEILVALRKRVPVKDFLKKVDRVEEEEITTKSKEEWKALAKAIYETVKGEKVAALIDSKGDIIKKVPIKEVSKNIAYSKNPVYAIVIDGTALSTIIKNCDELGVRILAATNFAAVTPERVELMSL